MDLFETYAPVVSWSTISILPTLVLQEWSTRQMDYDNAFAEAELEETVFVEPPKCFAPRSGKYLVL